MCQETMSSTKNNTNNNDEKNNENENIVLVDAADVIEVKGEEGFEEVDLLCVEDDGDIPTKAATEEESSEMVSKKEQQEPEQEAVKGPVQHFPWWKGGGIIPTCGNDLGTHTKSLEDRANVFELWWMSYMNPLLGLGSRKVLDAADVGVPSACDRAEVSYTATNLEWEKQRELCRLHNAPLLVVQKQQKLKQQQFEEEQQGLSATAKKQTEPPKFKPLPFREPSIALSLIYSFGMWKISVAILYQVLSALLAFVPVLILNDLVRYFEYYKTVQLAKANPDDLQFMQPMLEFTPMAPPWVEVVGLGVIPFLVSLLNTRHNSIMAHCGVFVRTAVSGMLYQKALTVSAAGRAMTSTGQVVNMMSNDTMQLQRFLQFIGFTMIAPVQIIIALALIYQQVGSSMWVGVAYMIFLMPINMWVFTVVGKMRRKVLKHSDSRVKMMNEILTGIRIIKFYAWERPFGREVSQIRGKEMDALTKMSYVVAVGFSIVLLSTPIVQPIFVFVTYVNVQDQALTAATAFTTVTLFNLMRFPFAFMPMGLLQYIQSMISLKRLERYLALPDLNPYVVDSGPPPQEEERERERVDASLSKFVNQEEDDIDMTNDNTTIEKDEFLYDQPGSITIIDGTFGWIDPDQEVIKPVQEEERSKKKEKKERLERRESRRLEKKAAKSQRSLNTEGGETTTTGNSVLDGGSIDDDDRRSVSSFITDESGDSSVGGPPPITLQNITTRIQPGSLVAVVGSVGSGKSSLLSAILGEMESINQSKVYIPRGGCPAVGFASYCTQSPWVINDTLRGNILFGREYEETRYQEILTVCALQDDIDILPAGDQTEIGERGINLSGGQKARVALARAMYSPDTRLLLLDDPLSAVDSHVGEHLFTQAIEGPISHGKTRILVTHHVHILSRCDSVIVMEQGTIKHQGSYQDLIEQGVDFAGAVDVSKIKANEDSSDDDNNAESDVEKLMSSNGDEKMTKKLSSSGKGENNALVEQQAAQKKAGATLVSDEEIEEGDVATDAYVRYARAGGWCIAILTILIQAVGRTFEIFSFFWLSIWADKMQTAEDLGTPFTQQQTSFYVGIFGLFGFISVVGLGFRGIFLAMHRLGASKQLHDGLSAAILRAPVSFFDVTPIGRVLNRFAADMDKLDLELTSTISQGINTIFQVLGALGAIVVATKGTFIIILVPLSFLYYYVQQWFRKTSTELQRISNVANSPIFADFSQTLSGTSSIRAYGVQQGFFHKCNASFDNMNASYVLVQLTQYWLALRLDVMGGVISMFIGAVAVGTLKFGFIQAGWLGLALSYSIEVTSYLKYGVQMIAKLEADMSSVERILYYTDNIKPEAPDVLPTKDPAPGTWPSKGEIAFSNASMRYRDGPLVLKGLTLTVQGGEKIGVCGRTGSGKSSLMIALFRISELEPDGCITIDGVNIGEIGTAALRLNISIIPQDPVMFSNTIRYNLDPFATKSEEELWEVLKKVNMAETIAGLPQGLNDVVAEGGENFSQGQRQLLCIGRSLLRKPKILVMDEATASIDNETDATIQQMIRENFAEATVLTIAHRLNTIMDSDRILVLDDGHIAELDTPENLMAQEHGHFKAMVEKSRASSNDNE